jgi:hypothetical protein
MYRAHYETVLEAENTLRSERDSRGMFVGRLENMQKNGDRWLTVEAVLALLNDCDMLAQRPNVASKRLDPVLRGKSA